MKVWFAGCKDFECSCYVIYDHKPTNEELREHFFCKIEKHFVLAEVDLDKILNKEMRDVYWDLFSKIKGVDE